MGEFADQGVGTLAVETTAVFTGRIVLGLMLVLACLIDWRERRIPNGLVLAGLAFALVWHAWAPAGAGLFDAYLPGALGLRESLLGALIALVGFAMLWVLRIMGAGDVKLMAAVGAFSGVSALPMLVISIFIASGVLALLYLARPQTLRKVLRNLQVILLATSARLSGVPGPQFDALSMSALRIPFALPIAMGTTAFASLDWLV